MVITAHDRQGVRDNELLHDLIFLYIRLHLDVFYLS